MPTLKKKAQVTLSEQKVNCAQTQMKPAKREKKSKISTNAESACPSFSRSLLHTDVAKEKQISLDMPVSTDESVLITSEGSKANAIRRKPSFEETMKHLFGPYAKAQAKPRRRWDLDTYMALFGPDGQIMVSENPRHYDVFELYRNLRMRPRKQQLDDTKDELFGDHAPPMYKVSHDVESPESGSTRKKPKVSRQLQINSVYVRLVCQ